MVLQRSRIAERIRAYVEDRKREEPRYSIRKLSTAAGLHSAQLTMVLRRLDDGADIDSGILESIARAMGVSLPWLLRGAEEVKTGRIRLGSLDGWAEAVAAARARYPRLDDKSTARLADVTVPVAPPSLEPSAIIALAVALDVFLGDP